MFGFWIRADKAYGSQCPACEQTKGVKHIETMFNGVRRYVCKLCGCTWMYKENKTEGQYADTMNKTLPMPGVLLPR